MDAIVELAWINYMHDPTQLDVLKLAFAGESSYAASRIAVIYNGLGERDKAIEWYKQAADMGYKSAVITVADLYYEYLSDYENAKKYYKIAIKFGSIYSIYKLGCCYEAERHPNKPNLIAMEAYAEAALNGCDDAKLYFDELELEESNEILLLFARKYLDYKKVITRYRDEVYKLRCQIENMKLRPYPGEYYLQAAREFKRLKNFKKKNNKIEEFPEGAKLYHYTLTGLILISLLINYL
jgi:tetratricopeptide (TPR) repeat protein